ncbi:hypothetical protein BDZ91DRAFT_725952 [Kalaharituber pfeilii]|nr:hypothetical protein BDZ91DRAFT_725952 [Kalaharituber pfeilii]
MIGLFSCTVCISFCFSFFLSFVFILRYHLESTVYTFWHVSPGSIGNRAVSPVLSSN